MSTTTAIVVADEVIATLRPHEAELRAAGIWRLSLFGSVARGDAEADSDVDLAVEFDPAARMDMFKLSGLEQRIGYLLHCPIDLLPEPVQKRRLQNNIDRDRRIVF